jgi:lipopolysaccharide assembly outer membrane protein LptD (OstA)
VKPQVADQVAVGYFRNFRDNMWETSIEVYYKNMANQIDYKNGADIMLNELVETQLEFGKGWAYGLELLLRKNSGNFHGWVSYTLAKSERQFRNINEGKTYPAKQDRIHDLSIVAIYDLNKKWSLSGTWVYSEMP